MSTVNRGNLETFVAGADLSSSQYTFVYVSAAGSGQEAPTVTQAADAQNTGGSSVYILYNAPASGGEALCMPLGYNAKLKVGAALALGAEIMIGTSGGKGIALSGATKYGIARALEASAADGDIIEVETMKPSPLGS